MEFPVEILQKLDIINLLAMFALFWLFNSRMDRKFDKMEVKIDKLDEKITDIDRRICRLEGAFSNKECCVIREDKQQKKAE